jgi:P4 family phage/plasmid primase-like protien
MSELVDSVSHLTVHQRGALVAIARRLLRNGYHPLRLNWGTKKPCRTGWLNDLPTEESIEREFKMPGNIGLIQGVVAPDKTFLLTIDIDQDDAPLLACVEQAIGADCIKKRGKKGISFTLKAVGEIDSQKLHDYRDGKKPAGDILAKGKQTVIPPSIHPETQAPYEWWGKLTPFNTPYSELPTIDDSVIREIRAFLRDPENPIAQLRYMIWKGVGGGGDTHEVCLAAVGRMVHDSWTDEQIHVRIRRAKREACERASEAYHWPAEAKTIQEWIDSARLKKFGQQKSTKAKPSHGELSDLVVSRHGAIIRRDKKMLDWAVFNGKFWDDRATEDVKAIIRTCLSDDQVFRAVIDGVENVMRLDPRLGLRDDPWDRHPYLLNCPSGTYDLRTDEVMPHDSAHLITKMTRVSPRFDYQDSLWLKLLPMWFENQAEIEYIQRFFGLCLTGETKDECVAVWIGKSGAGKSKMTDMVDYVMGDYAQTAPDTAFLDVRYHPHLEEIARMKGKRVVFIHEVEGYLNLSRIKSIASGEPTAASLKGKDSHDFRPQAKLWFIGNEAPPSKSSGRELQRRFHVYEFVRQISDKDMDLDLASKLRGEAEFILGWMIDGARKYYADGRLQRSAHVIDSTKRYFADADIMEHWVEERCVVDPAAVAPVAELWADFDPWADDSGIRAKPDKGRFSQRLKAKGYQLDRVTVDRGRPAVRVVRGLRLRKENELPIDIDSPF